MTSSGKATVVLSGGTGSAKLLRGLAGTMDKFTVVANCADNIWLHGLYVCPDLDTAMYTLAGVADETRGWGLEGDTFSVLRRIGELGGETWFKIGDSDVATHLVRTEMLRAGATLTDVTKSLCEGYRVRQTILPATDNHVETHILTAEGEMHLQEFWVKRRAKVKADGVKYVGGESAAVSDEVKSALSGAELVIFCPGNPVTSLLPILRTGEFTEVLKRSKAKKIAVSPMVGRGAFSGPAPELMRAIGHEASSVGVAELYAGIVDELVIEERDREMARSVEALGVRCRTAKTFMKTRSDERRLAKLLLKR